nr:hypothetical protein [Tanacetum cinerariifolium]
MLHSQPSQPPQAKDKGNRIMKFDFTTVKTASTPIEPNKALIKYAEAKDVDVHLYRSKIGSLMYLTASSPDIMFDVCACARFQVTPKTSHLHVVKRIFRYLKSQPKLGLWKSTIGGCQFLGKRLISRQCKKQTIDANSTTEAERKQRKETEVPYIEPQIEEHIPTPSHDPLPSGENRMQLSELMEICTKLSDNVLSLEQIKTNQTAKIEKLKQRGRIAKIDADEYLSLINEIAQDQGRMNDEDLFGFNDLDGDLVIVDVLAGENIEQDATVAKKEVSAAADEVVTTAKSVKAKPSARGVTIQEPSEFRTTSPSQPSQPPQAKDKGNRIMVEPKKPLKKKDQIALDEEVAKKLEAEMKAEIDEEERITREKDEENIAVIKEWDDVQATIDRYKQKDFKGKSFDVIKKMFDKVYKRVNTFVAMDSEVMEGSKKTQAEVTEDGSKRAGDEIEKESAKRQRLEKEDDTAELKRCLEIVLKDDNDVTIKSTPLSFKSPTIVDYKLYKERKKSYFKIIRADGNSQNYLTFRIMFKNFNREELEVLRSIVKERFKKTKPVNDMDNLLF